MKTFRTIGTGNEQTISEIETDKIPLYPSEQDLLDDIANLEVGQLAGTIDPAESELVGVLIQKIQELESKLESDDVYSTEETLTNKKWWNGTEWKDVYRKVIFSPQLSTTLITGVEDVINYKFNRQVYANSTARVLYDGSYDRDFCSLNLDTNHNLSVGAMHPELWTGTNYWIMFEYTKVSA